MERGDWSAGQTIQDLCRPCGMVRRHTVLATPVADRPARVLCDHCGSQHNYRGGDRSGPAAPRAVGLPRTIAADPLPAVSDREITMSADVPALEEIDMSAADLERMLRQVIREESGLTPVEIGQRWRGGELVMKPGREGVQDKVVPIETFFNKIVMLRNRLRTLEQTVNASDLPADAKAKAQGYITACYGSLTSFNVLFADDDDRFHGSGGK